MTPSLLPQSLSPLSKSTASPFRHPPTSKLHHREQCPECARLGRDTHEDNLGVYDDGHSYCFSCEYYRSPERSENSSAKEAHFQYLPTRGITEATCERFNCLTKVDSEGQPISIGFRYP